MKMRVGQNELNLKKAQEKIVTKDIDISELHSQVI